MITVTDVLAGSEYEEGGVKPVEIFADTIVEIICPDCGMLFEVYPKREWRNYSCPYCKKRFIAKLIIQAFWLEEGDRGISALV